MKNEKNLRPEISYLVQSILPFLSTHYDYPNPEDYEHVKIDEVPIRIGSSIKKPDVVYYWDGVPVLLVEAKKEGKSENDAQEQALSYVRNFPATDKRYSKDGRRPRFIATSVGKDINFYVHRYELKKHDFRDWLERLDTVPAFVELLSEYGLSPGYIPKILTAQDFQRNFLNELMAIYKLGRLITRDVILNVASQILSYLEDPKNYTSRQPYVLLDKCKDRQSQIRQLFNQYDIISSLNPDNAKVFRQFVLRSFQGTNLNQYMTEGCIIAFMINLLNIEPDWKILDFECGSGGFLAAAIERGKIPLDNIRGIDLDSLPFVVARTYLAIYFGKFGDDNIKAIPIYCKNGLFYYGNDWDLVISNPAGSSKYIREDTEKVLENLQPDLNLDGSPDSFSEYNFSVQQAVRSTKIGGKICLILPEGFFSNSQDEILRKYVTKHCQILAIISLPRGVFKVGTEVRQAQRGSRTKGMKMSILYAEKIRETRDEEGLNLSDIDLGYPVFIANVTSSESGRGEISSWLEPKLNLVLEQWRVWQTRQSLTEPTEVKIESSKKVLEKKHRREGREKLLFEITSKKLEKPRYKKKVTSKTKISPGLKDIFKKTDSESDKS